jgi:hypothetical protein
VSGCRHRDEEETAQVNGRHTVNVWMRATLSVALSMLHDVRSIDTSERNTTNGW